MWNGAGDAGAAPIKLLFLLALRSEEELIHLSIFMLLSLISLIVSLFVLGQQMCNDVATGLLVINASVTKRGHGRRSSH